MSQLPLLPQQQRTTTRYEPFAEQKSGSVFRPKLPGIACSDKTLSCDAFLLQGRHAPLHRAAIMGLSTGCTERATFQQRSVKSLQRSLHWLMYEETRERALIVSTSLAMSPVQCYNTRTSADVLPSWRFAHEPPITTSDAELMKMVKNAFRRVLKRTQGETTSPQHLEVEEAACRQRDIVEPWSRRCRKLEITQEMLQGKLMIWKEFMQRLEVWRQLIEVVREEKVARLFLLGQYVSCSTPLPCKYLRWDLELLEESAIPLEPEVNLVCLFVSIVIGENAFLQNSLLAEREEGLSALSGQYRLGFLAFEGIQHIRRDEAERFEMLMGYHAFCMKLASEESIHATVRLSHHPRSKSPRGASRRVKRFSRHYLAEYRGSLFIPYFTYVRVVNNFGAEKGARAEITAYELVEFCLLMYTYESLCRRVIVSEEEAFMQKLVGDVEAQGRQLIWRAEAEALAQDIQPDQFRNHSHALMQIQLEELGLQLRRTQLQVSIQLLVEYERLRRGEVMLLETKLRTMGRLMFYGLYCRGRDKYVVLRWMLQRQLHLLMQEEERLRLRIVNDEVDGFSTMATAHSWLVEYGDTMHQASQEQKLQHASCHLMAEHQLIREGIVLRCQWERQVLFKETLCVPVCTTQSRANTPSGRDCREAVKPDFDIRQAVICDLSKFLQDELLLTVFGSVAPQSFCSVMYTTTN
ncbi:hypothetical protein TraAM80_09144 [Trypanosoma rangeli]|uniref:Uncharacterized protein n=1 Tax=Trypanosoma rangeli TaxID=5698 RepID=A0A3R7KCH3_TRYRA|nr:uncharacterized protein TraAM80_09144 [Trypanosoma rangeli]RNE97784.1 hypothetical protein TraAM80_09144 [Trypanosoma rangeli]|eukprot:RNE97784.1 hypothetical protein TraAM80_09144 [Trypanosoma rangeli]